MGYKSINKTLKHIVDGLDAVEKDDLYRYLWSDHVREDVESRLDSDYEDRILNASGETDEERLEAVIKNVVERYVYDGDYDCNLSYWENIDNLIEKAVSNVTVNNNT